MDSGQLLEEFVYRRLMVLKLLPRSDSQPPTRKPIPTAPARIKPQGNSIDLQTKNFRLTRVAFWTDNNAIAITHAAAIAEMIRLVNEVMLDRC